MKTTTKKMMALAAITSAILLTGCQKDLYDPDYVASKNGLLTGVPSDFNWSTISSVNLTVNVDDKYNGEYYYVVEVFDSNPVINSNAKLLTKGVAKKGQAFSTEFSIPQTLKNIAIRQTAPTGLTVTRIADVASNITLDFASSATKSVSTRSSNSTISTKSISAGESDFANEAPAGIPEYENSIQSSSTNFILKKNYDEINVWTSDRTLYISGNITINKFTYLASGCKVYLLPGSTLTIIKGNGSANDPNLISFGQYNCLISINSGAKLTTQSNIQLDSNCKILNIGNFTAPKFTLTTSSGMINGGTVDISEQTLITNNGVIWKNEDGTYTTKNMEIQSQNANTLNSCKLIITNNLYLNSANLKIDKGAYVSCNTIEMNGARIDMGANAILNIITQANYDWNPETDSNGKHYGIYGPTSDKALLKIKKAIQHVANSYPIIHYGGCLQIECQDHPSSSFFTQKETVEWVPVGGTSFTIEKSGCSEGNNVAIGNIATNPSFPITVPLGTNYTYAIEDLWPSYGDYDFNDLVVTVNFIPQIIGNDNKVHKLTINAELRALGANKSLAAALQFDNIPIEKVKNISYSVLSSDGTVLKNSSPLDGSVFEINSNGTEADQTKAVVPLFDNAHYLLETSGETNTVIGGKKVEPKTVKIEIQFTTGNNNQVAQSDIDVKNLNFFIVTDKQKTNRTEVHLAGYNATDKVNKSLFGTGVDNSNGNTKYLSKDHLVWGIMIPTIFNFPIESTDITKAYPEFKEWAISGGTTNTDWYNSSKADGQYIYK